MRTDLICIAAAAAAALLTLSSPTTAAAQSGSGAPLTVNQQAGGAIGRMTRDRQMHRFENEEQRRRQGPQTPEEAEAEYGAERMELARQVAELIERGQCRDARALANQAGERQMALRVRQTCQSR